MKIYNGEGMILGRLAARVAKDALMGEEVKVLNCEKVVVSGAKTGTFAKAKQKRGWGGHPMRRQVHSRLPDRWVRRSIRGMLPWKQARGKEAFDRIMCYLGTPLEFKEQKLTEVPGASASKLRTLNYITLHDIAHTFGKKI